MAIFSTSFRFNEKSRSWPIALLGGGIALATLMADSSVSAQGLFGRIRARIEARQQPPAPGAQSPAAVPPATAPRAPSNTRASSNSPRDAESRVLATPGRAPVRTPTDSDSSSLITFGIDVTPARAGQYQGLRVVGFQADSRAPQAGLLPGDVILSIQGQRTAALADVTRALQKLFVGGQGEIQLIRNGLLYRAVVPVIASSAESNPSPGGKTDETGSQQGPRSVAKPPLNPSLSRNESSGPIERNEPTLAQPRSSLGLEVRNASPQRGIEVVVAPEGTAGVIGGLKSGDRIVSVEGRLVKGIDDLIRELSLTQPGDSVQFGAVRDGTMLEMDIEMGGPGGKPIRSATEPLVTKSAPDSESKTQPNSLLGGMGAALGGLFSTEKRTAKTVPEPSDKSSGSNIVGDLSPPKNANEMAPRQTPERDPLALPEDDSPQRQGSADVLPAPTPEKDPGLDASQTEIERLKAEVKRLQQQLEQ